MGCNKKYKIIYALCYSRKRFLIVLPCRIKIIVELMGDLPRMELFARQKIGELDVWGNEVESDIELH